MTPTKFIFSKKKQFLETKPFKQDHDAGKTITPDGHVQPGPTKRETMHV